MNTDTGEIIVKANEVLTAASVEKLIEAGIKDIKTLYTNDLDRGAFISDTLRIDPTKTRLEALVEIYRMMRPASRPPRTPPRTCSTTCSSTTSATTCRPWAA